MPAQPQTNGLVFANDGNGYLTIQDQGKNDAYTAYATVPYNFTLKPSQIEVTLDFSYFNNPNPFQNLDGSALEDKWTFDVQKTVKVTGPGGGPGGAASVVYKYKASSKQCPNGVAPHVHPPIKIKNGNGNPVIIVCCL